MSDSGPCAGLSVVEVAAGTSELGLGLAGGVPGMMLADLGATVTRVVDPAPVAVDRGVPWGRVWHRDKRLVVSTDPAKIAALLRQADVALVYGTEGRIEQRGLGFGDMSAANPRLIYARCRPSRTSTGTVEDFGLLVEARSGFCTQLPGHRPGPTFVDVRAPGSGAAFLLISSVLALLRRRTLTGAGGWAETSLYDGMLATLGCMIGRSERGGPGIETYWQKGSWFPNFLYRCADSELVQVWFGGKGMYASLIEALGDEPSAEGYYADQASGALNDRAARWRAVFATRPRDVWIERLRAVGVACEPVLRPGEALTDPHLGEIGLAVTRRHGGHDDVLVTTPVIVRTLVDGGDARPPAPPPPGARGLLDGVRVVDFSMFVAGPLAAEVLADLGAEVIKVEPLQGEAMRGAAYAMAACQRGKRSLAVDITAPEARPIVERLLRRADVVLHNFRVGVAERLGIDAATVAELNPGAVYCHASAFGAVGPRARFPGNDALMQAVTGFEQAIGGAGNDPIAATWIPIDMTGGWIAAAGILAGLYARAVTGRGQQVATSLLGAGMLLQSGVFRRDGTIVRGPELDGAQTGYGPGYRLYEGADGKWFALVLPDEVAWARLCALPGLATLEPRYAPLRYGPDDQSAAAAEAVLTAGFLAAPAATWVERLRALSLAVEPVADLDRDRFRQGILDDPLNRQLGRVVGYETEAWGHFEQIGPLIRCGPATAARPALMLPGIGEHSVEVLTELGFGVEEVDAFLADKVVRQ
jgi:crotonobetainyl-CoA:carnitine CoA-transferase CaiB-like acyl-CoA transferase